MGLSTRGEGRSVFQPDRVVTHGDLMVLDLMNYAIYVGILHKLIGNGNALRLPDGKRCVPDGFCLIAARLGVEAAPNDIVLTRTWLARLRDGRTHEPVVIKLIRGGIGRELLCGRVPQIRFLCGIECVKVKSADWRGYHG